MTEQQFIAFCCSDEGWGYVEALKQQAIDHKHLSLQALWMLVREAQKHDQKEAA